MTPSFVRTEIWIAGLHTLAAVVHVCRGEHDRRGQRPHGAAKEAQLGCGKGQSGEQVLQRGRTAESVDGGQDAKLDGRLERHGREVVVTQAGLRLQQLGAGLHFSWFEPLLSLSLAC